MENGMELASVGEYTNIQTVCRCNESEFEEVKKRIQQLMFALSLPLMPINQWLEGLQWTPVTDIEDNLHGFVFMNDFGTSLPISYGNSTVAMRPCLLGLTPDIKGYTESWLHVDFVTPTPTITRWEQRNYFYIPETTKVIWHIMEITFRHFPEFGIYLTNEAQDGSTMHYLTQKDRTAGEQWRFDAAIIPSNLLNEFTPVPEKFISIANEQTHYFANKSVWRTLPWEQK